VTSITYAGRTSKKFMAPHNPEHVMLITVTASRTSDAIAYPRCSSDAVGTVAACRR
jgi:hypothetical protein